MKEDTPPNVAKPDSAPSSTPATPRSQAANLPSLEDSPTTDDSQAVSESTDAADGTTTAFNSGASSSTLTTTTKDQAKEDSSPKADGKDKDKDKGSKATNLVGKINNLISTDLENITEGRDFFFIFIYSPLNIILGMVFLYVLLDWRRVSRCAWIARFEWLPEICEFVL
jgi:hypothetical protein